jgi:hypothetical protein
MKIIPPHSLQSESIDRQTGAGVKVHRRIEITTEREIVSVLVRGRPSNIAAKPIIERVEQEPALQESPPAAEKPGRNQT